MNHYQPATARVWGGEKNASAREQNNIVEDALDTLHTLPLSILPIETPILKRLMLVKNARLESVVELYSDDGSGGGQVPLNQLRNHFSDAGPSLDKDIEILNSLRDVGSFDVYTLRIALRELDIGFDQQDCLQLSQANRRELTRYMTVFTRPLIQRIYGPANQNITDMSDIVSLFTHPDRGQAVEQIHHVAEALGISVDEVPRFWRPMATCSFPSPTTGSVSTG
jgi:hypothetical protein